MLGEDAGAVTAARCSRSQAIGGSVSSPEVGFRPARGSVARTEVGPYAGSAYPGVDTAFGSAQRAVADWTWPRMEVGRAA